MGVAQSMVQQALATLVEGQNLDDTTMQALMRDIMSGQCSAAQIGGVLIALRMKGETVTEITAAARVMRDMATRVVCQSEDLLDIVGTGGDASGTFNVSTASAFVAAAAGAKVAKHGNRSISSQSGAADLLTAAGVSLELSPEDIARCIDEVGVGFMFAPKFHGAMKYAIGPRREMAVRTIFNVLGPLTNPAFARQQVVGVFAQNLVTPAAQVLGALGSQRALVVHSVDGMDEISISADTHAALWDQGEVQTMTLSPQQVGIETGPMSAVQVSGPEESLAMVQGVLHGEAGPAGDMVALNAGAGIYVAGLANTLEEGVIRAQQIIASGEAARKLDALVALSNTLMESSHAG